MSRDRDWIAYKFEWLQALLGDEATRGLAHDIGTLLAIRYLNATSEEAWPSIATLADDLGSSRRGTQLALNKLFDGGWLLQPVQGGGRHQSNRYRLPDRIPSRGRKGAARQRPVTAENGAPQFTVSAEKGEPRFPKQRTGIPENSE